MHKAQRSIGGESRGSKHQLLIDQSAKDARSRRTNLAISWIDYKKAYDSVPHSWMLECLRLYKIDPRLVTFIRQSIIATWKGQDEAAAWYEKPLHGAWHKGVPEVADMTHMRRSERNQYKNKKAHDYAWCVPSQVNHS